jgi:hypothetical protein
MLPKAVQGCRWKSCRHLDKLVTVDQATCARTTVRAQVRDAIGLLHTPRAERIPKHVLYTMRPVAARRIVIPKGAAVVFTTYVGRDGATVGGAGTGMGTSKRGPAASVIFKCTVSFDVNSKSTSRVGMSPPYGDGGVAADRTRRAVNPTAVAFIELTSYPKFAG